MKELRTIPLFQVLKGDFVTGVESSADDGSFTAIKRKELTFMIGL